MIINTNKQLQNLVTTIKQTNQIAVDTEFYWMRTYYPELCLVQIATKNEIFLIDTLDKLDFSILKEIFEDHNIEKIIHSATNDIPIIKRFFNCEINNVFDTQLAATFLGFQSQLSLKSLLKEILDIDMEKESQFSDWRKRPLSKKQLDYALKDVEHLIEIKQHLENKLEQTDYKDYYQQEILEIEKTAFNNIENIHTKIGNIQKFSEKIQKNAIIIAQWREKTAQEKNIPVRFLFDNKLLYTLAHISPKSPSSFEHIDLKKLKPWIKKGIINALETVKNLEHLTTTKKSSNSITPEFYDNAIAFFDAETKLLDFDATLVASRKDIRSLVYNLGIDMNYSKNKLLQSWRYKVVGKKLKEYILGNI